MPELLPRFENKYLLSEAVAAGVRDYALSWMEPDLYGEGGSYWVNSLYLDSWDMKLARATIDGVKNRNKLRMRCYDFGDSPVFCEDKGRVGGSIVKLRALCTRRDAEAIAGNEAPPPGGFQAAKKNHQDDLERFRFSMDKLDARPRLWVRYFREAFVSPFGDGARVTFDRHLMVQIPREPWFKPDPNEWKNIAFRGGADVVLELKYNGAFPGWMRQLVQAYELERISYAKYVSGIMEIGWWPWTRQEWGEPWTL